jgi:hypothetical protein
VRAIDLCNREHVIEIEAILQRVRTLAAGGDGGPEAIPPVAMTADVAGIQVPRPDLSRFDQLLGQEGAGAPPARAAEGLSNYS